MKKAVVIGSGVGGISTSIRLAVKGFDVEVYESNTGPGGKLSEFSAKGYRFDFGPSLFTLPKLVDELFELADVDPRLYFNYTKLDESCKYFYEDGVRINAFADRDRLGHEIYNKTGVSPTVIQNYFDHSKLIYDCTKPIFLEKSLHKLSSLLSYDTVRALAKAHTFDIFDTMHNANAKRIKEPHLIQLFDRYATYNGSNPYRAPGILNLIPTLEHSNGTYFPSGGMFQITDSLVKLARKIGVRFHYGKKVDEIVVEASKAKGIRIGQKYIEADIVVSNMDVYFTYKELLKNHALTRKVSKQERSSSALVFYWGIKKAFSQLGLHNIFFSENYQREFDQLFNELTISNDPTVYVNVTSKLNPKDAPEGHENWFVMINAPSIEKQNWPELIKQTRANVINKLNRMLGTDISKQITVEHITDPIVIQSKTHSYKGSLYGTSSNSKMAAFMRHPNFNRKIKNLFFCGGSVHPGGGIPLCLMSAKIVESLVPC